MSGIQFDVKSKNMTATGASGIGVPRARVKAIYILNASTLGSVSFRNGGSGAAELIKIDTPASTTGGSTVILVPGNGVVFSADPYLTLTTVTSVTFFYG